MKRTVKFAALALLVSTAIFATSCGGNASKKQSADTATETATETKAPARGGTELKSVNESNWQATVKANFGVDVAVPQGWTLKNVTSPNNVNNLTLVMTTGEGTTAEAEGRRLFDATKALSPDGNYKAEIDSNTAQVSAGDAIADFADVNSGGAIWYYTYNSSMIQVYYEVSGNEVGLTFTNSGGKK
jgi:hypothetical protein